LCGAGEVNEWLGNGEKKRGAKGVTLWETAQGYPNGFNGKKRAFYIGAWGQSQNSPGPRGKEILMEAVWSSKGLLFAIVQEKTRAVSGANLDPELLSSRGWRLEILNWH